jgi:hypothetical protein
VVTLFFVRNSLTTSEVYRLKTTGARGVLLPSSGFGSLRRNELHFREEDGSTMLRLTTSLEINWLQPEETAVLEEAIKKVAFIELRTLQRRLY